LDIPRLTPVLEVALIQLIADRVAQYLKIFLKLFQRTRILPMSVST